MFQKSKYIKHHSEMRNKSLQNKNDNNDTNDTNNFTVYIHTRKYITDDNNCITRFCALSSTIPSFALASAELIFFREKMSLHESIDGPYFFKIRSNMNIHVPQNIFETELLNQVYKNDLKCDFIQFYNRDLYFKKYVDENYNKSSQNMSHFLPDLSPDNLSRLSSSTYSVILNNSSCSDASLISSPDIYHITKKRSRHFQSWKDEWLSDDDIKIEIHNDDEDDI